MHLLFTLIISGVLQISGLLLPTEARKQASVNTNLVPFPIRYLREQELKLLEEQAKKKRRIGKISSRDGLTVLQQYHNSYGADSINQQLEEWYASDNSSSRVLDEFSNSLPPISPPVNSVYELDVRIPVIGKQHFHLKILSENVAELVIDGILKVNDIISYQIDRRTGGLSFALSEETKRIMRKFRTTIVRATYCGRSDTPSIVVSPPLPKNIKLRLKRKHK